jgi:predicted transcriptional regulator
MKTNKAMKTENLDNFQDPLENYEPPVFHDNLERALAEEPVSSIQCAPYGSIAPDASVRDAVAKLAELGIGCLIVMEGPKMVGLFSERDVLNKVAENFERTSTLPVSEVMTKKIMSIEDSDPAGAALCLMAAFGYRHAPVLGAKGDVVGIVSPQRMLEFLQRYLDKD